MSITYSNPRMEAAIDGWPIGNKRTTAHFAIETDAKRGQRGTRFTIDPRTGKPSATKKLTYGRQARIVDGSDGKTYIVTHTGMYDFYYVMQSNMQYTAESIMGDDPRFADMRALFAA